MFRKSIIVMAVAAVAISSLGSAAFAGSRGGNHGHNKAFHFIKITTPKYYGTGCYKYKKLYKVTHRRHWLKKYKACLILKH